MRERLFIYGSLGPGRPNEHVMDAIGGTCEPASVTGALRQEGWGAELGYPGLDLDEAGGEVEGFVFSSENLADHWATLDEFEGPAYERVVITARLKDGSAVQAHVYALKRS